MSKGSSVLTPPASPSENAVPSPVLPSTEATSGEPSCGEEKRSCQHCGTEFIPRFETETFCCAGCRVVYELIQSGGFQSFYDLLGKRKLQPVENAEPAGDFLAELEEEVALIEKTAREKNGAARLRLRVGNLSCTACVWLIDHLFRHYPGALKINSDTSRSILTLWWTPGEFAILDFIADLHRYGYPAGLVSDLDEDTQSESRSLLTRLGLTAGLAMNAMAFSLPSYLGMEATSEFARLFSLVAFASASLAMAVGGSYFFQRAWAAFKMRTLHMDVPISLGLVVAYLGSLGGMLFGIEEMLYYDFVATFAFLMLGGRWLHLRLLEKNRRQLRARERDLSVTFRIKEKGVREKIPIHRIEAEDCLEIQPGALIPVESNLEAESARVRLDWINGEPEPVPFVQGQVVPAGAKNGSATAIRVRAREAFSGSFLESLLEDPSSEGEEVDDKVHRGNPILKIYLIIVLVVAFLSGVGWIALGKGFAPALQVMISVLVVSCPCALGLALPLLDEMLLSKLKNRGIFIRQHSLWGRLRSVTRLAFDKTGTLTEPVQKLENPDVLETLTEDERQVLRSLTMNNAHPVGKALHEGITARYGLASVAPDEEIEEVPGSGVEFQEGDLHWRLGKASWALGSQRAGQEECVFSCNDRVICKFRISESIREGAVAQLRELKSLGFHLQILSGDPDEERVESTAKALGLALDEVSCNLSPAEKAARIEAQGGNGTLFVGDGGNDSLAFAAAGVTGAPATGIRAVESKADFVFTGRGFHAIGELLQSRARREKLIRIIFLTAITYNLIAVSLCVLGMMNPLLAAVLMPLSSIVTTAIAARV